MTKWVKFNCNTVFHNIPDDKLMGLKEEMLNLLKTNYKSYCERLGSEYSEFEQKLVKIDDEVEVPNWYYESYKDSVTDMPNSFDIYKAADGTHRPFNMDEAVRHRQVKDVKETTRKVKLFDLIRDLDKKIKVA